MPLYTAGQKIRAAELNALPQSYVLPSHHIKNANVTLSNLTNLAFAAEANAEYGVEVHLCVHANETADMKFAWTYPAGTDTAESWWGVKGNALAGAGASADHDIGAVFDVGISASLARSGDDAVPVLVDIFAWFCIDSTPGTVQLKWAQNTSNATDSFVRMGSWMQVTKLA